MPIDLPRVVTRRWLEDFPEPFKALCIAHGAWVVGSAARYLIGDTESRPRDWDILVPLVEWPSACRLIPWKAVANALGGYKVSVGDDEADIWPDDLTSYLSKATAYSHSPSVAVQPSTSTVLVFGKGRDTSHR